MLPVSVAADGTLESIASPCELSATSTVGRATNRSSNGEATSSHLGTTGTERPLFGRAGGARAVLVARGQRRGPAHRQRGSACAIEGRGRAPRHRHGGPPGRPGAGPTGLLLVGAPGPPPPAAPGSRQVPSKLQSCFSPQVKSTRKRCAACQGPSVLSAGRLSANVNVTVMLGQASAHWRPGPGQPGWVGGLSDNFHLHCT
jgi:hypothetical protein